MTKLTKEDLSNLEECFKKLGEGTHIVDYNEALREIKYAVIDLVPELRKDNGFVYETNIVILIKLMRELCGQLKMIFSAKKEIMKHIEQAKLEKVRKTIYDQDQKNRAIQPRKVA